MSNTQDDDYGFFYDIEDEYKKDDQIDKIPKQQIFHKQSDKNLDEVLYKSANYLLGVITLCITVASFYEIFS